MNILLDHNLPKSLRRHLPGHAVKTTREMGWETLANGALLKAASLADFSAFLSIDKNLEHEQNLRASPLTVIVIDAPSNALPALMPFVQSLQQLRSAPLDRHFMSCSKTEYCDRLLVSNEKYMTSNGGRGAAVGQPRRLRTASGSPAPA